MKGAVITAISLASTYLILKDSAVCIWLRALTSEIWAHLYRLSGESDFVIYNVGTIVFLIMVFIVSNAFFIIVDLTGMPKFVQKYRIQVGKNVPLNKKKYFSALKLAIFNLIFGYFMISVITWPIVKWRKLPCGYKLPTIPQLLFHLLLSIIVEEIGFYYVHRLLHLPWLYSRIHKIHHEWTAPVSITQIYCHPIEHICLNCLPAMVGTFVLGDHFGNHLISLWIWLGIMKSSSAIVHSGYHLPFTTSSEEHDFHHYRFNQNYGTLGVMDYLHGTSKVFHESKSYQRHFVLTGSSSARELIPD